MKSCPVCLRQCEDEFLFCSYDGSSLRDTTAGAEGISQQPASVVEPASRTGAAGGSFERKSHRITARATAVALALFGLAASYKQYDLTFDAQEQTGRPVLWKQLSLTTRSASGLNRSQMLPFSERLSRSGSFTFTVSAVLQGVAESDWRGRVICSSFGVDDTSRVVKATFSTDVSPW
ncbi:MAG TPA: hypothetical protein VJH03_15465 [Blastocatellia bacterium]|nr:hypothetical protein [Blastocatellia bacterium]